MSPSTRLTDCSPWLATAWLEIHELYVIDRPEHDLLVTCTYRSAQEQFALYCKGRELRDGVWVHDADARTSIVTNCDGTRVVSRHNRKPAEAIDFAVILPGGKLSWDPREYETVGVLAEQRNLVWGGRWAMADYVHVELRA
jgi:D-alanyl-D-alanine carboxypeptidase-like protein